MRGIRNFDELIETLRQRRTHKRVAVVWASDDNTRAAVAHALSVGFIEAIFVGCRHEVESDSELMRFAAQITIEDAPDSDAAAARAVELVRLRQADVLMKGMLNTDNLLRAVLNKQSGILPQGRVLTHITAAEIPSYDKLLFFTDAAVIPYPTDEQRAAQIEYVAHLCRSIGIAEPRISLIHCSEKVDERHFPFTASYPVLAERARKGDFGPCIVDGPLDVKTSCCKEALDKKHIVSPVDGQADALVFPDIEAGNTFYKSITLFAEAETAGLLVGTMAPVVLPSRGDSVESKYCSLALASF